MRWKRYRVTFVEKLLNSSPSTEMEADLELTSSNAFLQTFRHRCKTVEMLNTRYQGPVFECWYVPEFMALVVGLHECMSLKSERSTKH